MPLLYKFAIHLKPSNWYCFNVALSIFGCSILSTSIALKSASSPTLFLSRASFVDWSNSSIFDFVFRISSRADCFASSATFFLSSSDNTEFGFSATAFAMACSLFSRITSSSSSVVFFVTKCAYNSDWFNKNCNRCSCIFASCSCSNRCFSCRSRIFVFFMWSSACRSAALQNEETTNESFRKFAFGVIFINRLRSAFLFLTSTAHMCANKRARRSSTSFRNIAIFFVPGTSMMAIRRHNCSMFVSFRFSSVG
mmetsp:Transcript_5350/g.16951  ORF Transcript_5350/g.16951 Transcript_5350/m.16951 type:complete len:253 (-) Transcript_5350:417-1175(-)